MIIRTINIRRSERDSDKINRNIDVKPVKWIDEVLQDCAANTLPEPLQEGVEEDGCQRMTITRADAKEAHQPTH